MMYTQEFERHLAASGDALGSYPALRDVIRLADSEFHYLLEQRRFVSLAFTPFYDMIIDALDEGAARLICREIVREEYPYSERDGGKTPSHREQLVQDLVAIGLSKPRILASRPSATTVASIGRSLALVGEAYAQPNPELALIAIAACYEEELVAREYRALLPRIEQVLPMSDSVFYVPHLLHDSGHAKRLLDEISVRKGEEAEDLRIFDSMLEHCLRAKLTFYHQFES